jgi:hypothetical protein
MKKKLFMVFIILAFAFFCVFGLRIYGLVYSTWDYFHTDVVCSGQSPTPPKGIGEPAPFPIFEIKPFSVITNYGNMYPGDEYNIGGDDSSGVATLLWPGKDGATFLVKYKSYGYRRYTCRWFIPIGNYR